MISDAKQASDRLIQFLETGLMPTVSGGTVKLNVASICVHGDGPHAVEMATQIRNDLQSSGFELCAFMGSTA